MKIHHAFILAVAGAMYCVTNAAASSITCNMMPKGSEYLCNEKDEKRLAWIEKGKDSVRELLKDGNSAKFRGLYFSNQAAPVVCGEVKRSVHGGLLACVTHDRERLLPSVPAADGRSMLIAE